MNAIRIAAYIALVVTLVAGGYLCYFLYRNEVHLEAAQHGLDCAENGTNCDEPSPMLEYGVSGGIAVVGLITSLVLFGASKPNS